MGKNLEWPGPIDVSVENFQELPISQLSSVVAPVVVIGSQTVQLIGTAFNIAPAGILITAKHVIEEALEVCGTEPGAYIAVLWVSSGIEHDDIPDLLGGPIRVVKIQVSDDHDVALIQLQGILKDGEPFLHPIVGIDTKPPPIGAPVMAVGYTNMAVNSDESAGNERFVALAQSFHASHGQVEELFVNGRDSVLLPFASFQTSARFDPGMSGGPVFSGETGQVCGIVCSAFTGEGEPPIYTSFAAMMLNAITLYVTVDEVTEERVRLYQLIRNGVVVATPHFSTVEIIDRGETVDLFFPA